MKVKNLKKFFCVVILCLLMLSTCEKNADSLKRKIAIDELYSEKSPEESKKEFQLLNWKDLIPVKYRNNKKISEFKKQLDTFKDGDLKSFSIYKKMIDEMQNAPINLDLRDKKIRLAGFIAPLEITSGGDISEFLLVPYFGACIHIPPPPNNQTVLIKTAPGSEVKSYNALDSISVAGQMKISNQKTELGEAGYEIDGAIVYQ